MVACRATLHAGLRIHASEVGGSVPVNHGLYTAFGLVPVIESPDNRIFPSGVASASSTGLPFAALPNFRVPPLAKPVSGLPSAL